MKIALFTNGNRSILGTDEGNSFEFESLILFQDPDLLAARFLFLVQNKLYVEDLSKIEYLIFSLSGTINKENNILKKSFLLNDISRIKLYDGFNFNIAFREYFRPEQILLVNDALSLALGVNKRIKMGKFPCLVLSINDRIGVSFVSHSNNIMTAEWGGDFVATINKNSYEALGRESIYNLLLEKNIDVFQKYTEFLSQYIKHLNEKYAADNSQIKSVLILGEKAQYVNEKLLVNKFPHYDITVIVDNNLKNDIALKGCFSLQDFWESQNTKIIKIQYYSGQELIYEFDEFQKCLKHFISVKAISNPENYYKIFYSNKSIKIVSMKELNDVNELQLYGY